LAVARDARPGLAVWRAFDFSGGLLGGSAFLRRGGGRQAGEPRA